MALTDDDKQWIVAQLADKLAVMETGLADKLAVMETGLADKLAAMETGLADKLAAMETVSGEKLEDMETKLLTAFHEWASPADARLRGHTSSIAALEMEMASLIERVKKLEGAA